MNARKFRSMMALHGDNVEELAKYLNITPQSLRNKLSERGGTEFKQGEIARVRERYNLTAEQVEEIFFD